MQPNNPPPRTRPELELGPLGGDTEFVKQQVQSLIRTFSGLLDADIKLVDDPTGGKTDCFSTIWLPLGTSRSRNLSGHVASRTIIGTGG